MFCQNCRKAMHSNEFGYEKCRGCETEALTKELELTYEQIKAFKDAVLEREAEIKRLKKQNSGDIEMFTVERDEFRQQAKEWSEACKKAEAEIERLKDEHEKELDLVYDELQSRAAAWKRCARRWKYHWEIGPHPKKDTIYLRRVLGLTKSKVEMLGKYAISVITKPPPDWREKWAPEWNEKHRPPKGETNER